MQNTHETSPRARTTRRLLVALAALIALVALGFWLQRAREGKAAEPAAASASRGGGARERATAVRAVTVSQRDVPTLIDALGTVVPTATVTVRTQVDGRLDSVRFTEGQAVKRGDLLATVDARPLKAQLLQLQAIVQRDQAQLDNARRVLDRVVRMRSENLASQQELDDQRTQVSQLAAQLASSRAQVQAVALSVDFASIRSPIDGIVGVRQVDAGNLVRHNDAQGIVVVTAMDPITVVFSVPQDRIAEIVQAQAKAQLPVQVSARDGQLDLGTGSLQVIDNQIDPQTSMVRLRALMANPERLLWPGAFVRARLQLGVRQGALTLPEQAVQPGPEGMYVFVVGADSRVEQRSVRVEPGYGDHVVLLDGVRAGEQVVLDGHSLLRPGAQVTVRERAR